MGKSPHSLGDVPNPTRWKTRWPKSQEHHPDEHDIRRLERRKNVLGHFVGCGHYESKEKGGYLLVDCGKHGLQDNCDACYTCPACGGNLFLDRFMRTVGVVVYQVEDKACLQCGLRVHGKCAPVELPKKKPVEKHDNFPPRCAVEGCKRRTWEGIQHEGQTICFHHADKMTKWRNRGKREDAPLLILNGKLVENKTLAANIRRKKRLAGSAGGRKFSPKKGGIDAKPDPGNAPGGGPLSDQDPEAGQDLVEGGNSGTGGGVSSAGGETAGTA